MNEFNVIVRPLVTEQGMHFANTRSAYCFEVNKKANKIEIRNAIEKLYSVKVDKVRTSHRRGKAKRRGRHMGLTRSWKKAIVYLKGDDHIDLF